MKQRLKRRQRQISQNINDSERRDMELEFSSDERLSGTERNGEARGHLRKNGEDFMKMKDFPTQEYRLKADIDLSGTEQTGSVIPEFSGVLDGEKS